ncbi:MAG: EAL domain-containing protein [Planctomycetota bacterium]
MRHIPVEENPFVVGRRSGAALRLGHPTVSGHHASLWVENGVLIIKDMGSTNGTFVNGVRVDQATVSDEDLIHFAEAAFRVRRQSATGFSAGTLAQNVCDQAFALVQFDRLMNQRLVVPHFQPIVEIQNGVQIGHEILGRGKVFGLESVNAMFEAAEQLNLEVELSRLLRWEGIRVGRDLPDRPVLFVNTHPKEMDTEGLVESMASVREMAGELPMVLEIHEAAVTRPEVIGQLAPRLRDLNIELAYDDFGAGQARLQELVLAKPDYVKFDISLIRNIDLADEKRVNMLGTLVKMVRDLDIKALAEGIETSGEAEICKELDFDYAQGYFYGRPAPA